MVLLRGAKRKPREECWIAYCLCVFFVGCVSVSVLSLPATAGSVCFLSYSLLLDLIAAAGLSLRDLDLGREIASHVVVGRLVAADAVGQ